MKSLILTLFAFVYLNATNPIMLPLKGVEVEHTYSNGIKKKYLIERNSYKECLNLAVDVETFQSENLASSKVNEKCKKTFITTKGTIQPLQLHKDIKTYAELEVLEFIENNLKQNPESYILVDSRTKDWFDKGTIPSATNIPYDELEYDEDFELEYKRAFNLLGIKILKKDEYDFSKVKTALFFCNASWCAQSPRAIKTLIKIGFPKDKILWYRGGVASWVGVSLPLTEELK
ncbi:rhodanese-like domain-containing protein [Halarcobacter bivalviorum]|uniref:Rhodanese-like domain-containing protein n=1 Tax=Halarcobacter bivalviorum TaxID=663364 RepID=A0AAX2A6P5_9BACT|nr:rhodanese-like domain-containing protein [Halarcobacter bivalviorum]AXH12862.1 rhodanese-like domain-containing protein [Halarcobacter bivalviorum]RXK09013.1 hypothetical protein CRV05_12100 [Halarcobacter bivalviorum]